VTKENTEYCISVCMKHSATLLEFLHHFKPHTLPVSVRF